MNRQTDEWTDNVITILMMTIFLDVQSLRLDSYEHPVQLQTNKWTPRCQSFPLKHIHVSYRHLAFFPIYINLKGTNAVCVYYCKLGFNCMHFYFRLYLCIKHFTDSRKECKFENK